MFEVKLVANIYCEDGCCTLSILHRLPFIPTVGQRVVVYLPALPDGWNEDAWEIGWDDEEPRPSVYISTDGAIEVWFDLMIKSMPRLSVIADMQRAGWIDALKPRDQPSESFHVLPQ
jgi:hypothetical protein